MKKSAFPLLCCLLGAACGLAQTPVRTPPKSVKTPTPGYPAALTDTGKNGAALIDVLIKADGSVTDPRVKFADDDAFAAAAMGIVTKWRFEPGTRDGVPADMRVAIPFKFSAPLEQQLNAMFKRKVYVDLTETVLDDKTYGKKLKLKDDVPPVYPRTLLRSRVEEKVQVSFVIAPNGTTLNPVIVGKPRKEFILPALAAIARCTYAPPVKDGHGVYVATRRTLEIEPPARRGGGGGGGGGGDFGGSGDFGGRADPGGG